MERNSVVRSWIDDVAADMAERDVCACARVEGVRSSRVGDYD